MDKNNFIEINRNKLGLSVDEQHRGLKNLDFFADHASSVRDMRYMADDLSGDVGTLYLRAALTNVSCPVCHTRAKRDSSNPILEWLLKFSGRKMLRCTSCGWREIVKETGWQWETVATMLVAFLIVAFASIYWILR